MSQPTLLSVSGTAGDFFLTLNFDQAMNAFSPPPLSAFQLSIQNGPSFTITGLAVDSAAHTISLYLGGGSVLGAGDEMLVSYTDPTGGDDPNAVQGLDGTDVSSFNRIFGVAPAAPPAPALDPGSDGGTAGDNLTNVRSPTVTGTAVANATVHLYDSDGTTLLGTTTADGAGAWQVSSSALSDGDHTLKVTQTDSNNNTSPLSAALVLHIDTTPPTVNSFGSTIYTPGATVIDGDVAFSEDVTGVDASDFTVVSTGTATASIGAIAAIQGSGARYTVILDHVAGDGTIRLDFNAGASVTDAAGNAALVGATGITSTIHGPPTVSIAPETSGPTNAATLVETVTFSTAVTGVDAGDFTVGHTGSAGAEVTGVSTTDGGVTYAVELTNVAGDGTIHLDLNASGTGIQDGTSTPIAGGATGADVTVDHTAPTIASIIPGTAGPTHAATVTETVTFAEAVTGVDASDFTVGHTGSASAHIASASFSGSGATYTVTLDQISGDGTIHLDLNATGTGIEDAAGNPIAGGATGSSTPLGDPSPPPVSPPVTPPTSGSDGGDILDLRGDGVSNSPHIYAGQGGADTIYGGNAGDTLQGNTGDDIIQGGAGGDQIHGGQGGDQMDAGGGNDLVFGDLGNDSVAGGAGNDILQGNTGGDSLAGGAGNDVVLGGQDQDRLEGGDGGDTLSGDLGHDTLQGNTGADALAGGAGNDVLLGGQGDDRLDGGDGGDFLSGDRGNDTLTGGAGADVFSFAPNGGVDHIADFNAADGDRVLLQPGATYTLAQVGADTVIDLGHGDQLVLDNVQLTSLPTGWILG